MSKVNLSKIAPLKNGEVKDVEINGVKVAVKQYLPVQDKIALTERVLARAFDDTNYFSIYRLNILRDIEIVKEYTNINITEKQLEDVPKLYDIFVINGILNAVMENIPVQELDSLKEKVLSEANNLEHYLNSFNGIMKTISTDYSNTEMNVEKLTEQLNNPDALATVKEILDKIG